MQDIACGCKKTETERKVEHSNNSLRERLLTHKAHIRSFDNQTSASCKILHLSVKTSDRNNGGKTVTIHVVYVSVLIKLKYGHLIIKL